MQENMEKWKQWICWWGRVGLWMIFLKSVISINSFLKMASSVWESGFGLESLSWNLLPARGAGSTLNDPENKEGSLCHILMASSCQTSPSQALALATPSERSAFGQSVLPEVWLFLTELDRLPGKCYRQCHQLQPTSCLWHEDPCWLRLPGALPQGGSGPLFSAAAGWAGTLAGRPGLVDQGEQRPDSAHAKWSIQPR